MLEIENTAVVVVFISLEHNDLRVRLVGSNYFYKEESIPCTNFCVRVTPFACMLRARS